MVLSVMDTTMFQTKSNPDGVKGFVASIFEKYDTDKSDRLSREQFVAALQDHPDLAKVLSL